MLAVPVVALLLLIPTQKVMKDCDQDASALLQQVGAFSKARNSAQIRGNISEEINAFQEQLKYQTLLSEHCPESGKYEFYGVLMERIDLALLLEGNRAWDEAENLLRKNSFDTLHNSLGGDDLRSQNDLALAYLLKRKGNSTEAAHICRFWKHKVVRIGKSLARAMNGTPPSLDDTPEQETGAWTLACADAKDGAAMLENQIVVHPSMLASYQSLANYYIANGDFERGRAILNKWEIGNTAKRKQ